MVHGLAAAMEAPLTGISGMLFLNFCSLSFGSLVHGALVAAVVTTVWLLAWAVHVLLSFLSFRLIPK